MNTFLRSASVLALFASALAANAQYVTSFEAPTYAAGSSIVGQDGWSGYLANSSSALVSSARASSGGQSVSLVAASDISFLNVGHGLGLPVATAFSASVQLYMPATNGINREFGLLLGSSTGSLPSGLGLSIDGSGRIRAGKTYDTAIFLGTSLATATAGTFTDRWLTLGLIVDGAGNGTATLSGLANGSSYSYSFTGVSTSLLNVSLASDYAAATNATGTGYFDDLAIVPTAVNPTPEPSALAALGLGGLAVLRRRKRA